MIYGHKFLNSEKEISLNEVKVYSDNNISISIDGDGFKDRGFSKDPYFKISIKDTKNSNNKENITRIAFKDKKARYVIHNNQKVKLNSSERKALEDIMNKKSTSNEYKNLTVWQAIKQASVDVPADKNEDILSYEKPDFTIIHEDVE